MLIVYRQVFNGNILDEDNKTFYIQNVLDENETFESIDNFSYHTSSLNGCGKDALFYEYSCILNGKDVEVYSTTSSFEDNTHVVMFMLCNFADSAWDLLNDYYSVLDSISYAEEDESDYESMYNELLEQYNQLTIDDDATNEDMNYLLTCVDICFIIKNV